MSIEFRRGRQRIQWDGTKLFGTAPVVLPPPETARSGVPDPEDWAERLLDLLDPKTSVCLVVPDATRVGAWQSILPTLLQIVPSATAGRCTLLVATGTHRPATRPDLASHLLGPDGDRSLLDPWNVHQNSEEQFATHRRIGATPNGIEVRLHPLYLDSEIRILLGELSYHYFAGIGGGPKLVFPGLGEPVAAGRNHRRAVVGSELHPNCYPGNIRENPVHTDILAAVDLAPPNWVVSVQYPIQITQGPYPEAFFNAVDRFDTGGRIDCARKPDLMIVDGGGTPRDASLLQAHKSLQHGSRFLDSGGSLLWIAACDQGYGSPLFEMIAQAGDPGEDAESNALHLQTWTAFRSVTKRIRVALWSDLPAEQVRRFGIDPIESESEAVQWCLSGHPGSWGWLPRAERFVPVESAP